MQSEVRLGRLLAAQCVPKPAKQSGMCGRRQSCSLPRTCARRKKGTLQYEIILYSCLCKTQEDINNIMFIKVLRGGYSCQVETSEKT